MVGGQLITDSYRELNRQLHQSTPEYGGGGYRWTKQVIGLVKDHDVRSILDYGCGKGALKRALGFDIFEYDPAIKWKAEEPPVCDMVVCSDVLEHVEKICLLNVINHFWSKAKVCAFVVVSLRLGKKVLANGSPAHVTVESPKWWLWLLESVITDAKIRLLKGQKREYKDALFVIIRGNK